MSLEEDYYLMMIKSMRTELTDAGFRELLTPEDVDGAMQGKSGTTLVFVNSVCGCAGGLARPGVTMALEHDKKPDQLVTVFAGQDQEATARARDYFNNNPPSSPSIWLFKDGELVDQLHRGDIEGTGAHMVAAKLKKMFDTYCA